ncbi:conjugal transfer protein TraY [Escherichia coli]|uniref:conjugal transfer relaxosome protein TraY n=1 Tax=Escherichia coli TaxID=562 RepID=UPI000942B2D8|nr:conjugal transfer relaxosome protein TraY [Escherichia coli]OKW68019.1 conjugal transfer protein TraY [Escherichia coli]
MSRNIIRPAPGNKVLLVLDDATNNQLIRAKDRSGRSKTIEVQIRLRDHLKRFPDFYNLDAIKEGAEETDSIIKDL